MQRRHPARACTFLGLSLLTVVGQALAQQPETSAAPDATQQPAATEPPDVLPPDMRPSDVTPATQDATQPSAGQPLRPLAAMLFAEGTSLLKQWRFEEAELKYREALTHGRHPLIHLYLARALEKQGRLIDAYEALRRALRPGVRTLPPEDVQEAERLHQRLESRLAQIEVYCDVPGAEVFLDGEPWFTAPGRVRRMIIAGQHALVARKLGYFPVTVPVSLSSGKQTRFVLRMTADVTYVERSWQPWQPWAVVGAGLATSLAGGLISHAEWNERIGTGVLLVGGTIVAAGLAGVLKNRPRTRRSVPTRSLERLDIQPMVSGDTAGISARLRF